MAQQPEIKVTDLKVDQLVRITFKRPDNSWREVIWKVLYADERTAILDPHINGDTWTKRKMFDVEQVSFWDATALAKVIESLRELDQ